MREVTTYDTGNTEAWSRITTIYDDAGRLDRQFGYHDNGTQAWHLEWDETNAETWGYFQTFWDAQGRLDYQLGYHDNGVLAWRLDWDQAEQHGWARQATFWTEGAAYDARAEIADNGVGRVSDLAPTGEVISDRAIPGPVDPATMEEAGWMSRVANFAMEFLSRAIDVGELNVGEREALEQLTAERAQEARHQRELHDTYQQGYREGVIDNDRARDANPNDAYGGYGPPGSVTSDGIGYGVDNAEQGFW